MFEFTSKKLSESTVLWSTALTLHPTSRTGSARTPSGRYLSFELLLHRGNGKYRQLPQPPNKCFPIAAPLVVFAPPLCHPHQDVEYLLYSEPLRRPSDLPIFGAIAKISRADLRTSYSDGRSSSEPALRRSPRWHALPLPRLGHIRQGRSFRYRIAISTRLVTLL